MAYTRTTTGGGIPIFTGPDVAIVERADAVFRSQDPPDGGVWFGAMTLKIHDEEYVLDEYMNFGAEGQTYMATRKRNGRQYAMKFCQQRDSTEISLLQAMPRQLVTHPNFLTYEMVVLDLDSSFEPAKHIIVMEYVPNGELFNFIASPLVGGPASEGTSRRFLHDVICGMAECYRFGVTHRDLKPENLLLNEDGQIIIIDFGHAKRVASSTPVSRPPDDEAGFFPKPRPLRPTTTCHRYGTVAFNAPEAFTGCSYNCEASDVWSIGVIAFMLHARLPPFSPGIAAWSDVAQPQSEAFWRKLADCGYYPAFPEALKQLVNTLWRKDPADRPSFSQLEAAVNGNEETLAQFPGLQWLREPTNGVAEFIGELCAALPEKAFNKPVARRW